MKKFILGFLTAALLLSVIPALADAADYILHKANYKIMVNGTEYADPILPTLNYNGATYVPLKKVADLLGVKMQWNADSGQAEINNTVAAATPTPAPTALPMPTPQFYTQEITVDKRIDESGKATLEFVNDGGVVYIAFGSAGILAMKENQNVIPSCIPSASGNIFSFRSKNSNVALVDNISTKIFRSRNYIDYSYFQNTILPLLKGA